MRAETLSYLKCPDCESGLRTSDRGDITTGSVLCSGCKKQFPILAGVLVLVSDVESYLVEHVKGISRYVDDHDVPKKFRSSYLAAKREIVTEHIEEDLEAERVTALYLMTHYLKANEVSSPDPVIQSLIQKHWDHGPFAKIRNLIQKRGVKKGSLIELGCGVGGLFAALRNEIGSYLGLDSSFSSIALARHFALGAPLDEKCRVPHDLLQGPVSRELELSKPKHAPQAEFVVCDLAEPPVKSGLWQMTAALNVIDMLHEPRDLPRLQYELLAQNGFAIQSCPYIWHPDVAANLRKALPKGIKDSAKAVEWLYEKEGFKLAEVERHVPWLFFKNIRQLELYSVHVFTAEK